MSEEMHYISLGGSVKLMSEGWYLKAFEGRLTAKGFRKLCESLGVPMLAIGRDYFVDMTRFELAMAFITRIGQPNFAFPASATRTEGFARHVDPEELRDALDLLVEDVMAARKLTGARVGAAMHKAIKRAVDGMVLSVYREMSPAEKSEWVKGDGPNLKIADGA